MCSVLSHELLNCRAIDFYKMPFGKSQKIRLHTNPLGLDFAVLCCESVYHHLDDGLLLARHCAGKDGRK